jgi:hypothetical protein
VTAPQGQSGVCVHWYCSTHSSARVRYRADLAHVILGGSHGSPTKDTTTAPSYGRRGLPAHTGSARKEPDLATCRLHLSTCSPGNPTSRKKSNANTDCGLMYDFILSVVFSPLEVVFVFFLNYTFIEMRFHTTHLAHLKCTVPWLLV